MAASSSEGLALGCASMGDVCSIGVAFSDDGGGVGTAGCSAFLSPGVKLNIECFFFCFSVSFAIFSSKTARCSGVMSSRLILWVSLIGMSRTERKKTMLTSR